MTWDNEDWKLSNHSQRAINNAKARAHHERVRQKLSLDMKDPSFRKKVADGMVTSGGTPKQVTIPLFEIANDVSIDFGTVERAERAYRKLNGKRKRIGWDSESI